MGRRKHVAVALAVVTDVECDSQVVDFLDIWVEVGAPAGLEESGVAFGYLMNRPGQRWQTPRTNALIDALDEALGRDKRAEPASP